MHLDRNNEVVQALERDNYRMDCPTYANDAVYSIMKQTWHTDPEGRPSFNDVAQVRACPPVASLLPTRTAAPSRVHACAAVDPCRWEKPHRACLCPPPRQMLDENKTDYADDI